MAVNILFSCCSFVFISVTLGKPPSQFIAFAILTILDGLPMFALLYLLAAGAVTPALSARQQYVVRALVLSRIAQEVGDQTVATLQGTPKLSPSPAYVFFSGFVSLSSSVAFIVFLITLSRRYYVQDNPERDRVWFAASL